VHLRSAVAALLVVTLAMDLPRTARAEEEEPTAAPQPFTSVVPDVRPIGARLALVGVQPVRAPLAVFAPTPDEIRLSRGAKTAIIVTAIVVGALLIVGAVAISRPGHL
jgi:hypothetical protein